MYRQGVHRRFVGLEVQRGHAGDGARGQSRVLQRLFGETDQLVGVRSAFTADAQDKHRRMQDQIVTRLCDCLVGDANRHRRRVCEHRAGPRDPICVAGFKGKPNRVPGQQRLRDGLRRLWVRQPPTGRRIIQGQAQGDITGGGDGGNAPGGLGDGLRQMVGAMVPAQQRHHRAAVRRHRDDGGLTSFVIQNAG